MSLDEDALCVRSATIQQWLGASFSTDHIQDILRVILADHCFVRREIAEKDEDYRQIIPYVVVRWQNNYLLSQRTKKQTESRLHNKFSLGLGGHINTAEDVRDMDIVTAGLWREIREEVHLSSVVEPKLVGIINDITTNVSRVHLGLAYVLDVTTPEFRILETDKIHAEWADLARIAAVFDDLESWSQIVYAYYVKNVPVHRETGTSD